MKTSLSTLCALLVMLGALTDLNASPIAGNQNSGAYLLPAPDLSRWSCGVYLQARRRGVVMYDTPMFMESRRTAGYLGYDILPWLTGYGILMDGKHQVGYATDNGSNEGGGGILLSLLDTELFAPGTMEDVFRVNATLQYTEGKVGFMSKSISFKETYGALTIHIINELDGSKLYWPDSIGLFLSAVYSTIDADHLSEGQASGFNTGLEFFLTDRVTLNMGIERFDSGNKYLYGLHIRF